jgi:UDP-glucose 4-epimerase
MGKRGRVARPIGGGVSDNVYRSVVVVGGAGFIGSHLVRALLGRDGVQRVVVYDNFSSGRRWHLEAVAGDPRLEIVEGEVEDLERLTAATSGASALVHLASNPDIARAMTDPTIDFHQGTQLTHCAVEAARRSSVGLMLYASGSGVYGDLGDYEAGENYGPLEPVSTYGASKLAGEALISSYCHMFGLRGRAFRFGNVVGPNQTHGVGFDFVRKLLADPTRLEILGDGTQSKSYVHVDDVLAAVLLAGSDSSEPFAVFNVATGDYITVAEIAALAVECLGLEPGAVKLAYSGGNRGWKGDVPVVRVATDRIRSLGWKNRYGSRDALRVSMLSMLDDARAGRLW